MHHSRAFVFGCLLLVTSCGRGGFNSVAATNDDALVRDLTLAIIEPAAGALIPSVVTVRGTCNVNAKVQLVYGGDITPVDGTGCEDGTFAKAVTFTGEDGIKELTVSARAVGGSVVSDARAFRRSSSAPVFSLDESNDGVLDIYASADTSTFTGTCEVSLPVAVSGPENTEIACVEGVWSYTTPAMTDDGTQVITLSQTDGAGNTTSVTVSYTRDTQPPVIDAITINNGQTRASGNVLPFAVTAHDVGGSGLGTYRAGVQSDLGAAAWQPSAPETFTFPLTSGTYSAFAQVRDRAGNASDVRQSGTVTLAIGSPPLVNVVGPFATQTLAAGETIMLSWSVSTPSGNDLTSNPIRIAYTTNDGISTTPIAGTAFPNSGAGCADGATGCAMVGVPTGVGAFRFVVLADDSIGNTGAASSLPFNAVSGLRLVAGRNARSVGQSALAAAFETNGSIARDPRTGDIYFAVASGYIVYKVDARTGIVTQWAGAAGTASTLPQSVALKDIRFLLLSARRVHGGAIVVDHASNVYLSTFQGVYKCGATQCNRIVGTISGGSGTGNGVGALAFDWSKVRSVKMQLASDDRLYLFTAVNDCYQLPTSTACGTAYRLEDNNTLTRLVGTDDITAPVATGTVHGVFDARVNTFRLLDNGDGAPRLLAGGSSIGDAAQYYYEVKDDGNMYRIGSLKGQELMAYDPTRRLVAYFDGSATAFLNPDAPSATFTKLPNTLNGARINTLDVIIDEYGGAYVTTDSSNRILYAALSASAYDQFAGAALVSADGEDARYANIRGIQYMGEFGTQLLFYSNLSAATRYIDAAGKLATITPVGASHFSTGPTLYFTRETTNTAVINAAGTCVFFCGGSVTSEGDWIGTADTGTPTSIGITLTGHSFGRLHIATEGQNSYFTVYMSDGTNLRSFVRKFDGAGTLSVIAGSNSLNDIVAGDLNYTQKLNASMTAPGNTMLTAHAGAPDSSRGRPLHATSTGLFMLNTNANLLSGTFGGSWTSLRSFVWTYARHPSWNRLFYSTSSFVLHRIAYDPVTLLASADTTLGDLSGVRGSDLKGMTVDPSDPNTLLFATDTQIFALPISEN